MNREVNQNIESDRDENFDSDLEKNSYTYQDNHDYEECMLEMIGKKVINNHIVQQYENGYALILSSNPQIYG